LLLVQKPLNFKKNTPTKSLLVYKELL